MNWGQLGAAVLGNLTHVVSLVETIRGKRKGQSKQDLAVDLFFAVVAGQDGAVATHIQYAEEEVRDLITAFVSLENKLGQYKSSAPDGISSFRVVDPANPQNEE